MKILTKIGLLIVLCLYLMLLSKLILFKNYYSIPDIIHQFTFRDDTVHWSSNNFIPFKTINFYLSVTDLNFDIRFKNLVGNIIGFVPFGFLLPLLSRYFRSIKRVFLATFSLSLIYELIQLVFKFGSFDVDDLMLNTLGGILGYLPIFIFLLLMNFKKEVQKNRYNG